MVEIYYNGKNAFSGIAPTPFVGVSSEFIDVGENWNQVTKLTLEGTLTGKFLGQSSSYYLNESLKNLALNFSEHFKNLEIRENNIPIYSASNVIIDNINVDENRFYGVSPFTVELTVYDSGVYSEFYGIKDPSDQIEFQEEGANIVKYTRTISAKGFREGSNSAISNAKAWVNDRKLTAPNVEPILVKNNKDQFLLESENEVVDRFNGAYTLTLTYSKDVHPESIDGAIFSYSIDISFDESSGVTSVSIQGELSRNNITILRQKYNQLDLFRICSDACFRATGKFLRNRVISKNISENGDTNVLTFSAEFNDDESSEDVIQDITVSINYEARDCNAEVTVSNNISCKIGSKQERWQKVLSAFNGFNPYFYASQVHSEEVGGILNPNETSETIRHNEFEGTIDYTINYNDKRSAITSSRFVSSMSSSVSYKPSVNLFVANTAVFVPREHNIQNVKAAPRSSIDFAVAIDLKDAGDSTAIAKAEAESVANVELNRLRNNYLINLPTAQKEDFLRTWDLNSRLSINETWSFEGPIYSN
jgi:hypothetical protein